MMTDIHSVLYMQYPNVITVYVEMIHGPCSHAGHGPSRRLSEAASKNAQHTMIYLLKALGTDEEKFKLIANISYH